MTNAQEPVDERQAIIQLNDLAYGVDWTYDSQFIAVGTLQTLSIFDNDLNQVSTQDGVIYSLDWHPSENMLAVTAGNSVEIMHWDAETLSLTILEKIQLSERVYFVRWNVNASKLAIITGTPTSQFQTGLDVAEITIWDGITFVHLQTIPSRYLFLTGYYPTTDLWDWSPNDPDLFAGIGNSIRIDGDFNTGDDVVVETDTIIYVLDTVTGERIQEISVGNGPVGYSLAWQPNGDYIAVGGETGSDIFHSETGEKIAGANGNHFDVFSLAWQLDGTYLASEQSIFDSQTFDRLGTYDVGDVRIVLWSPDNQLILFATGNKELAIFALE
ncbi:MAG: hypothetical protein AAF846_19140 [Chloroflexota bacterium]